MLSEILRNWSKYKTGYQWKGTIDVNAKRNMDVYSASFLDSDQLLETYLPQFSAREPSQDYKDRKTSAKTAFMNFPSKIVDVYKNSVFRSGEPNREGDSEAAKRFVENVDGANTHISRFVRDEIFLLEHIHGGVFVVVDKPQNLETGSTLSRAQQDEMNFYPYAYLYYWTDVVNFRVDRHRALEWIIFSESVTDKEGNKQEQYRYFDKNEWAVIDREGKAMSQGSHNLGVVPVYMHFQRRNPSHKFLTPVAVLDDVFRLTIKLFQYMSQLEQMIVRHIFLKLAMPEGMWKKLQNEGMGNMNVFVFEEGSQDKAYYIQSQYAEIDKMIDLVFNQIPDKILYFATLREKVSMPREESGVAKFVDSSDEISNLLEKANSMERAENNIIKLAQLWENDNSEFRVSYNKVFDIKSTNEQIEEIVKIFKQDMGSPAFNRQLVKRLMRNLLGEVPETVMQDIEKDLEYVIDPSLSIEDIDILAAKGYLDAMKLARKYNPELRNKKDDEVREFIQNNIQQIMGSTQPVGENEFE